MRGAQRRDGTRRFGVRPGVCSPAQRDADRAARFQVVEAARRIDDERRLLFTTIARDVAAGDQIGPVRANHRVQLGPRLRKYQRLRCPREVFQRQPRILGAAFLRDLPLQGRDHRRNGDFLLAPHPQCRSRPIPEKLHLRAVFGEGVAGNEEAKHRFLP